MIDILSRFKKAPSPNWKFEKQTNPPTFGWARMVDSTRLAKELKRRKAYCRKVLNNPKEYCDFKKDKVSLVILSCRRWDLLKGLIEKLRHYFKNIDNWPVEKVLVDNGSGSDFIKKALDEKFFDKIIAHPRNIGMVGALRNAYKSVEGEYILFLEDDFVLECNAPFLKKCIDIFMENPEIGIIRFKNQNNWWKPHRVITPLRMTLNGTQFWTWLPSRDGMLNVWCAGSVIFRKVSYFSTNELPDIQENMPRTGKFHQGYIYECEYAREYNKRWLAAKIMYCYPFFQPNINKESPGWGD